MARWLSSNAVSISLGSQLGAVRASLWAPLLAQKDCRGTRGAHREAVPKCSLVFDVQAVLRLLRRAKDPSPRPDGVFFSSSTLLLLCFLSYLPAAQPPSSQLYPVSRLN